MLLTSYIETYIADLLSGRRLKNAMSERVSATYARSFHALITDITCFEKDRVGQSLTFDTFTLSVHDELLAWYHKKGLLPNTVQSKFKKLHAVFSAAYDDKLTTNKIFCHSDFIPRGQEIDNIYLSPQQILQMYALDLSSPEKVRALLDHCRFTRKRYQKVRVLTCPRSIAKIEHARDIFIIGCLTGQRVSDYARISDDMLLQLECHDFIRLQQIKTGKEVVIPMDRRVADILRKYNGFPPRITRKRMNDVLQLLGEMLGWTWTVPFDKSRIGRKRGPRFCDMISTHTARRSFATNAFIAHVPLPSIMAVTGHTTERNLRRYLKLHIEERALIAYDDLNGFLEL